MSTVTRNSMLSSLDARLKSMLYEAPGNLKVIGDKLFKNEKTTRAYEIYNRFVGVGEASEVAEGGIYPSKEIKQGTAVTVEPKKFGFRIDVTREQIVDNIFEPMAGTVARAMKNAMVQTKERRRLNVYNNGFATTTTADGGYLFSATHALVQGGTQSNLGTAAALDIDTLWSGINTMSTTLGNSGIYDSIYLPRYLALPQALERVGCELLKSEWIPHKTENQVNAMPMLYDMEVVKSPLFSSSTAWFLVANPSDLVVPSLVFLEREPLSIQALFDVKGDSELGSSIDLDVYSWRVRERYETGAIYWQGLYGNAGA